MGKSKLERFEEVRQFENVLELNDFQDGESTKPKGRWHADIFGNEKPITLELACGSGDYTLELARRNPDQNYIGIDIKGARIWRGAKTALEEELANVRFLRIYIDHLEEYFAPGEVDELWITFPDPYPKYSDRRRRLSAPKFLSIYQKVLEPGGIINFKTDSNSLFEFTLETIRETDCETVEVVRDVYEEKPEDDLLTIKTYYEKRHLADGKTIKFVAFSLPDEPIAD